MAYGATILDAEGLTLTAAEKAFFRDADPFGFILFARNIDTPDQVRALCAELRDAVGRDAVITIDQEGGRVQRLRGPTWREWPAPLDLVTRAAGQAPRAMYMMFRLIADELRSIGVDSDCAPMLDLAGPDTHEFLRNRCYGTTPAQVAENGRAVMEGLLDGGVLPVIKHLPGHGRATLDSHFDLPTVTASHSDLMETDFAPFAALRDAPMGMTGHLVFDQIDAEVSTNSPKIIDVIRRDIGFDNLLMSDDLSMKALSGTPAERVTGALNAGCDVALYCNAPLDVRVAAAEAAGVMNEAAQTRAEAALAMRKTPDDIDIPALERDLKALMGEALNG